MSNSKSIWFAYHLVKKKLSRDCADAAPNVKGDFNRITISNRSYLIFFSRDMGKADVSYYIKSEDRYTIWRTTDINPDKTPEDIAKALIKIYMEVGK